MFEEVWRAAAVELRAAVNGDGGFGPRPGMSSEPEPTALAAIALAHDTARAWLEANQRSDGGLELVAGHVRNDAATGLAAIALPPGEARERAIDHVLSAQAVTAPSNADVPHDPRLRGWAWSEGTFGWVEPTARALLALRLLRPKATSALADAVATLEDREVVGGGWNYGNREAFGVELPAFAQTTAVALLALHGVDPLIEQRGLSALRRLWRVERAGALSLATSTAALRLHGDPDWTEAAAALGSHVDGVGLEGDIVSLAWAAIATGPGLGALGAAS